jgi:hypothetical protein
MSRIRIDRCEEYAGKPKGLQGAGRSEANLKGWSERATENSEIAPRASDGPMKLPSTTVTVRDSSMKPKVARKVNTAMAGRDDLNHVGTGGYLKNIRRDG